MSDNVSRAGVGKPRRLQIAAHAQTAGPIKLCFRRASCRRIYIQVLLNTHTQICRGRGTELAIGDTYKASLLIRYWVFVHSNVNYHFNVNVRHEVILFSSNTASLDIYIAQADMRLFFFLLIQQV